MSLSAQSRLDQDMRSVDTRIEETHGGNFGPRPFGSLRQLLRQRPLLVAIHIVEKERRAVARPAKLDNRQAREQHQLERRPVGKHRKHDMLGKVQALFWVCHPRPELIGQLLELVLQTTNAPDFPPHFLTW